MDNLAWFIAPFLGFGRTSVENLFALLLFSIGSIHTYFVSVVRVFGTKSCVN
jgi:hypothetical protein